VLLSLDATKFFKCLIDYFREYKHTDLLQNDIALVILKKPLVFKSHIRPICFPYNDPYAFKTGHLSAWGHSEINLEKFEVLQIIGGEHMTKENCLKENATEALTPEKFCMKSTGTGLACRGDSGGGYFVTGKRKYLVGILSNAAYIDTVGCSYDDTLVYLTNISLYTEWIRKTIYETENDYKNIQLNLV